jgi:cytosine/adenosine deaminase-related metal-dependent hydrolase
MASSIIRGKHVITRVIDGNASEVIDDGAVYQEDGVIVEVGGFEDLKARYSPGEVVGDGTQLVMPGLVNAHHHVGLTPFQLGSPDLALEPWIVVRTMNRDVDNYLDTLYCAIQMIESGITTVMHNHATWRKTEGGGFHDSGAHVLQAYQDAGMRVAFSFSHRDQNRVAYEDDERFLATLPPDLAARISQRLVESQMSTEEYVGLFEDLSADFGNDPRIRVFLSPGNVQWCSDAFLEAVKEAAARHGTGIHIHLQESFYQKLYGMRTWGKTPLAHLRDLGFTGPEVSCAHGVWLTESDIRTMAETGTMVCHNASSNLRLKSGIAPLNPMLDHGVSVALGIDEAGLNDDNDMIQEMRLVHKIHREPGVYSPAPTSHQVLRMATVNGARATFFGDNVGTLEAGKRADVVLVDMDHINEPYLESGVNIVDALLYRGRGLDVDTVIVDGEALMRGRVMTRVNKGEVWRALKDYLSRDLSAGELERIETAQELLPHVQKFYGQWHLGQGASHYRYNQAV